MPINKFTCSKKIILSLTIAMLSIGPLMPLVAQAARTPAQQKAYDTCLADNAGDTTFCTQSENSAIIDTNNNQIGTFGGKDLDCTITTSAGIAMCLSGIVYAIGPGIAAPVANIAAQFMSIVIQLSLNSTAYALDFLSQGWTLVRDLANMAFIFILIYLAVTVMLSADTANTMRTLAWVIIMALLINFSFFLTRVVIDAGNIVAVQFYNAIDVRDSTKCTNPQDLSTCQPMTVGGTTLPDGTIKNGSKDLTAGIMNAVQIQNLFSTPSFTAFIGDQKSANSPGFFTIFITLSLVYIAVAAMFWILIFAFLHVGIKFLLRTVGLWLVIIAAPAAFAARALGATNKFPTAGALYKQWQDSLVEFSFYPAVFLFIFFILSKFVNSIGGGTTGGLVNSVFNSINQSGGVSPIYSAIANVGIRMGLVVVMLYFGLKVADRFVKEGAKAADWTTGKLGGATRGTLGLTGRLGAATVARIGRENIGKDADALAKSAWLAKRASQPGVRGSLWRFTERRAKNLAGASYDIRNAPGAGYLSNVVKKVAGGPINVDTPGGAGGFSAKIKREEDKIKAEKEARAAIIRKEADKARDKKNQETVERVAKEAKAGTAHSQDDINRVQKLTKREFDALKGAQIEDIAHVIKESQLKQSKDRDDLTDEVKEKIDTKYHEKNPDAQLQKSLKTLSEDLHTLNSTLKTITLLSLDKTSPTSQVHSGAIINDANVQPVLKEIRDSIATLHDNIKNAPTGTSTKNMQSDLHQLNEALKTTKEFKADLSKIPPRVGSSANAGEYVAP